VKTNNHPIALAKLDFPQYQYPAHIKLLNRKLIEASLTPKKIIVNIPPRHGKSELISRYFPAWYLCNFPDNRLLSIMNSADQANKYGRHVRDLIVDFGRLYKSAPRLNPSSKSVTEFAFENYRGEYYAKGAGSTIVGKGADIMIIDDPISGVDQILTVKNRDKMFNLFVSDYFNRLEPKASIIIVMHRWHVDDLVGRLIQMDLGWEVINIPAIAYENDILGRKPGEALWTERYSIEDLENIKKQSTAYVFNSKYQQTPTPEGDSLFPDFYFLYTEKKNDYLYTLISYDTAFKDGELNDYTGYVVFGIKDGCIDILESGQKKLQYPKLRAFVLANNEKWKPNSIVIEDKASGQSLIQELKQISSTKVVAKKATDSKYARAMSVTSLMETGKVFFVGPNDDLVNQLKQFPFAEHDDLVDAFSHGLIYSKKFLNVGQYYF